MTTHNTFERLGNALAEIYHNATLPYSKLADINRPDNHEPFMGNLAQMLGGAGAFEKWRAEQFGIFLDYYVTDACNDLAELVKPWGGVYQYGRGGRTLAPKGWVKESGTGWRVLSWPELLSGVDTDSILESAAKLLAAVEAFNARQAELLEALPDAWAEWLAENMAEEVKRQECLAEQQRLATTAPAMLEALKLCAQALKDHTQYDDGESLERDAYNAAIDVINKIERVNQ